MTGGLLALLLAGPGAAHAQGLNLDNPVYSCTNDDIQPIWGTSGYANTVEALRTNATTWSATQFAEKRLFRELARGEQGDGGAFGYELNLTYNVSRLPVYSTDAGYECPAEYRIAERAVDMQAQNIGFAFRKGNWGGFYASSVAFGAPALDPFGRVMLWSMAAPIYSVVPLTLATVLGSFQTQVGASAYAQDFIFGLTGSTELVDVRAGYTRSRGLYASAQERRLGLYGAILLRDQLSLVGQAQGGIGELPLGDRLGRTSVFGRALPLTEELTTPDSTDSVIEQLLTGHIEQEDLLGRVDVRLAYAARPVRQLHQALVGLHSSAFYEGTGGFLVQGGVVTLPRQAYFGTEGGPVPSLRAEARFNVTDDSSGAATQISGLLMMNDAEQIALYPFAVGAVSGRISVDARF